MTPSTPDTDAALRRGGSRSVATADDHSISNGDQPLVLGAVNLACASELRTFLTDGRVVAAPDSPWLPLTSRARPRDEGHCCIWACWTPEKPLTVLFSAALVERQLHQARRPPGGLRGALNETGLRHTASLSMDVPLDREVTDGICGTSGRHRELVQHGRLDWSDEPSGKKPAGLATASSWKPSRLLR